jgi:hypothetical protein
MDDLQQNTDHEIISHLRKFQIRILFKFITTFSTALLISWFLGSIINNLLFVLIVVASSGCFSLILLLINKQDLFPDCSIPRLILLLQLIVSVLSVLALTLDHSGLFIASAISGLLVLFSLDLTCSNHRKEINFILYAGEALITCLLIISFLSMLVLPFLFLAALKAFPALYYMIKNKTIKYLSGIRILRIMILLFAGFCLLTRISYPDNLITFIFICGELIEMILYNYNSGIPDRLTSVSIESN